MAEESQSIKYIKLTSHPSAQGKDAITINWGAASAGERGPIIATLTNENHRNVIGTHAGSYKVYRALAVAAGVLDPEHIPDLTDTNPAEQIGPFPAWVDPTKIVSLDPYGATIARQFKHHIDAGYDIRPTIAITKAHIILPELTKAIGAGRLKADGKILKENGEATVTKVAIEPVWYLPGIAKRFRLEESDLRHALFKHTAGMYPELVTRPDIKVFLPPIGGATIYIFGEIDAVNRPNSIVSCRVHDECNGSDVFGSDICTCRPYLTHGIEVCIETAQRDGCGVIVYNRKEGRALGEVTKFLVYNARKRQKGGDRAEKYFERTECVAGVQDMRFQELMPDPLHWLGITKIDRFVSMSNVKYEAIVQAGIKIKEQVSIPDDLVPADAQVEIDAKKAAGYYSKGDVPTNQELTKAKGRGLKD